MLLFSHPGIPSGCIKKTKTKQTIKQTNFIILCNKKHPGSIPGECSGFHMIGMIEGLFLKTMNTWSLKYFQCFGLQCTFFDLSGTQSMVQVIKGKFTCI